MATTTTTSPGAAADPLADVPTLTTHHIPTAHNPEDAEARIAALKLITDSIAQQRQTANSTLIFHPYNLAITAVIISVIAQILRIKMGMDWLGVGLSSMGVLMAGMAVIRILTQGYIARAEEMGLDWLGDDEEKLQEGQKPSDVWVTRYGQEVIGAVVVDWLQSKEGQKKSQGQIKGWAVRMRYRGKGVGTALLEEVVQEARKKGVVSGDVVFAEDHANSLRVLPSLYNKLMDKRDARNRELLASLQTEAVASNATASSASTTTTTTGSKAKKASSTRRRG